VFNVVVVIGLADCDVLSQTDVNITCESPPGEGLSQVVVVTVSGQMSNSRAIDYAVPFISNVSPDSGAVGMVFIVLRVNNTLCFRWR